MLRTKQLQDKHLGETCVVIGNGPSLKDTDLPALAKKFPTFGSNKIFLYPFIPTYYAVCDHLMMFSCIKQIQEDSFNPDAMWLPRTFPVPGANLVNYAIKAGFSRDPSYEIVIGGTVTYVLLQLAFYMGFNRVLLVGVDHSYPGAGAGTPGAKFIQQGEDQDHFHPDYFEAGMIYNRPELEGTEVSYHIAKNVYEGEGRKILNASVNTNLLVYDRVDVNKYY